MSVSVSSLLIPCGVLFSNHTCLQPLKQRLLEMKPPTCIPIKRRQGGGASNGRPERIRSTPLQIQSYLSNHMNLQRIERHIQYLLRCVTCLIWIQVTMCQISNICLPTQSKDSTSAHTLARYLILVEHRRSQVIWKH